LSEYTHNITFIGTSYYLNFTQYFILSIRYILEQLDRLSGDSKEQRKLQAENHNQNQNHAFVNDKH
jgi:hypothetical protein